MTFLYLFRYTVSKSAAPARWIRISIPNIFPSWVLHSHENARFAGGSRYRAGKRQPLGDGNDSDMKLLLYVAELQIVAHKSSKLKSVRTKCYHQRIEMPLFIGLEHLSSPWQKRPDTEPVAVHSTSKVDAYPPKLIPQEKDDQFQQWYMEITLCTGFSDK